MRRPLAVALLTGLCAIGSGVSRVPARAAESAPPAPEAAPGGQPPAASPVIENGVLRLEVAGRKAFVPATTVGGVPFVSVKGLAAAAGARVSAGKKPGELTVTSAAAVLAFAADRPSLVLVSGPAGSRSSRALSLPDDARTIGSDLYVPLDAVGALLEALLPAEPRAAARNEVGLTLVGGDGFMRLVIQPAAAVGWSLDRAPNDVSLRLRGKPAETGDAPWAARPIGNAILDRIRFEPATGAMTLRLDPGPGFSGASAVELRNPFRIVVEMRGDANRARTVNAADAAPPGPPARRGLQTVVLDPGHGGEAKGAEGTSGQVEKEITLDVANRLAALLRASGLRVVLTRQTDADLGLVERTAAANREKADLFMSIHVNSSPRRDARGAETYYLAYQALDQDGRDIATAENEGAGLVSEGPTSSLDLVLWDLAQAEHLRESSRLAETVQRELNAALDVRDRGVKQAPFRVLMGAAMPAVLVETGFISNPEEEKSFADPAYRDRIAGALARAVMSFKQVFDRQQGANAS